MPSPQRQLATMLSPSRTGTAGRTEPSTGSLASRASTATTCSRGSEVRAALDDQPGTYFLTDFLARTFEHTVWRELGLDRYPELRDDYFGNYTPRDVARAAADAGDAGGGLAGGGTSRVAARGS